MLKSLKQSFVTGLILTLPLGITVFFINLMLQYIGGPASRILFYWLDIERGTVVLSAASIFLVALIIVLIGFLSKLFFGRMIIAFTERFITHVPLVSAVYKTVKQVIESFGKSGKESFSKVVLVEFPKQGCYAIGFLSSESGGEIQAKTGEFVVNVFVPTAPNPTSGFLLMVPKRNTVEMEMSVSEGMKLVLSGGIVVPPYEKK
jgi:uncharacterized membrane protein